MRKHYLILSITILALACHKHEESPVNDEGTWIREESFPGILPRLNPTAISSADTTYYGLGYGGRGADSEEWFADIWIFAKDKWTKYITFPGRLRHSATGFVIHGKLYVGLGSGERPGLLNNGYRDFWQYDPVLNVWDSLPYEFPGELRTHAITFSVGGKGYLGTGINKDSDYLGDFYEFNPSSGWQELPGATVERQTGTTVFVMEGSAYIGFGRGNQEYFPKIQKFLPAEERWETVFRLKPGDHIPATRTGAGAFVLRDEEGESVYIVGGEPEEGTTDFWTCCCYNPRKQELNRIKATLPGYIEKIFGANNQGYLFSKNSEMWQFVPGEK